MSGWAISEVECLEERVFDRSVLTPLDSFLLNGFDVELVLVEKRVHRVDHIILATQLHLKALFCLLLEIVWT